MLAEQISLVPPPCPIPGKNVLVVGHSGGDNEALVSDLLKSGANVIWSVQGSLAKAMTAVAAECVYEKSWRSRLHMPCFDVQKSADVVALAQYCETHFDGLDAVVANFGDHGRGPKLMETSVEDLTHTVNGRLFSHLLLARTFTPILAQRSSSAYIFINGNNSLTPTLAGCLKSAAAAAELALARSLSFEMGGNPYVYSLLLASVPHRGSSSQFLDQSCIGEAVALIVREPAYAKDQVVIQGQWRQILDPGARSPDYCSSL